MDGLRDQIRSAGEQLSQVQPDVIPGWLTTAGIASWLFIGIAITIGIVGWFFGVSASISIPLLLAMVIGMIAYPLCERMTARGVPKSAAAGIVLILLGAIIVGVIWVTLAGVISQWPNIVAQVQKGLAQIGADLQSAGVDTQGLTKQAQQATASVTSSSAASNPLTGGVISGVGSVLGASLSGIFALFFGVFIAATLLFYVLSDYPTIIAWLGSHMGLRVNIGEGILDDAVNAMRGYFRGTTITGVVVAVVIGGAMLIMKVPLAPTVALVTFLTCYIPFFGAIISGAFAFVVALGANGLTTAIILLIIVLLAQNVLQVVINARVMGDSLNLHPLIVLVVTMLGGIFGGLLGAALGAPVAALLVNAAKRLSAAFGSASEEPADTTPAEIGAS